MPSDEWKEMNRKSLLREKKEFLVDLIEQGTEELERAYRDRNAFRARLEEYEKPSYPTNVSVTLDAWPPRDWFRFQWTNDWSVRYFQVAIGPIRLDIFE